MKDQSNSEIHKIKKDSYSLLVQAVERIADYAIFMLDPKGNILTWNLGAERIKGYKESEIVGKHFSIFYSESDLQREHPQEELKIASKEGKFEEEGWRIRKDGSRFWANVLITRLSDEKEKIIGFSKVTRDLTERKQAQEELLASESRFRLMVEGVKDYAIFMLDVNGHIATWNQGAENLKGYSREEIIGKHFSIFYPHSIDRERIQGELVIAKQEGKFEEEGYRVKKDGSEFWASVLITPIFDSVGTIVGFSKVTRDLTERKEAENHLRELNKELDQRVQERTEELEKTKNDLEQSLKYRDEFMSLASHELKTPITSLMLQIEYVKLRFEGLIEKKIKGEFVESLEVIESQANRLTDLVEDLLDVSRIKLGKLHFSFQKTNLTQALEDSLDRWDGPLRMEGCELSRDIKKDVHSNLDKDRFDQVISNLLSNCIKYAPGRPVKVSLDQNEDLAVLTVRDHGPGIDPSKLDLVFERFGRGVGGASGVSGLGLGLFISKSIAKEHKGDLKVEGKEEGCAFILTLPSLPPK